MTLNNENNNDCCKCTTPEYEIILEAQGPQGRQGEKGEPGFTPIISIKDNTDSTYTLNILTQDGPITTPNLKANLPLGGATGQVLTKNSGEQDDCSWQNLPTSTIETEGIARLATEADFKATEDVEASDNTIVTPALFNSELKAQVNTFIVAGDNITTSVDGEGKVTVNATAEAYSLPQANTTTLGGIKANPKTDDDTQPVNIDTTTGLLYTKAGGGETPANVVTTDTAQTITGVKEFTNTILTVGTGIVRAQQSTEYRNGAGLSMGANNVDTDGGPFCPIWVMYNTDGTVASTSNILTTQTQTTLSGQNFNNANQLVRLEPDGKLPALDGSRLTNLPGGGSVPDNVVTTNTYQTITAGKIFEGTAPILIYNNGHKFVPARLFTDQNGASKIFIGDCPNVGASTTHLPVVLFVASEHPGIYRGINDSGYIITYTILDTGNIGNYVDGTTITYTDGKLKASGGSTPTNMVTTDTNQTITEKKTFNADIVVNRCIRMSNDKGTALDLSQANRIVVGAQTAANLSQIFINAQEVRVSSGNLTNAQNSHIIQKADTTITIGDSGDTITDGNGNNIVTTKDIGNLKYWTGTEEAYTGIETKNADTLYRTTDTNKVYLGTIQIGG